VHNKYLKYLETGVLW